jgi:hypothetical protein
MTRDERGDWMQTYTGQSFYPTQAYPDEVNPIDIAHALSMLCRYGGHVNRFYSVAEHCVLMSQYVEPENALWTLLHDATEAYVGDMVRPLKRQIPAYVAVEDRLMEVICRRFGLPSKMPAEVAEVDSRIIHDERRQIMNWSARPWSSIDHLPPLGVHIEAWSPGEAKRHYLNRLTELWTVKA